MHTRVCTPSHMHTHSERGISRPVVQTATIETAKIQSHFGWTSGYSWGRDEVVHCLSLWPEHHVIVQYTAQVKNSNGKHSVKEIEQKEYLARQKELMKEWKEGEQKVRTSMLSKVGACVCWPFTLSCFSAPQVFTRCAKLVRLRLEACLTTPRIFHSHLLAYLPHFCCPDKRGKACTRSTNSGMVRMT